MNPFGVLSDTSERLEPVDVEFFKLTSLVPDAKVSIQADPFTKADYPTPVSLIACSSKLQYFVAGSTTGFVYGSTKSLRTAFYNTEKGEVTTLEDKISVPLSTKVRQIEISATETSIIITTSNNTLLIYHVEDIKREKEQVKPTKTINLSNPTLEIKPNPEVHPNLVAILYENNTVSLIDIETGDTTCTFPSSNYTALSWSRKGKQIVCGDKEGSLIAYDTSGTAKDTLTVPTELINKNRFVQDVLWVDNNVFFTIYSSPFTSDELDDVNDAYIIDRKINQSKQEGYTCLPEITPIYSSDGRGNRFYIELVPHLGKEINNAIIIANAAANDISVVGENEDGEWNTWLLPENGTATLPLTDESQDTYPLGLALDFAADEKLAPFDASENEKPVEPFPVFYYINDEGQIGAYHCYNVEMARRGDVYVNSSISETPKNTSEPATISAPPPTTTTPSAFGSSFAKPSTTGSSFSDLLSGKTTSSTSQPSFGFGSFGAALNNNKATSGSFASLAGGQKLPAAPSMGMSATQTAGSTPAFGSTSTVGFGTQSSFGAAAVKPSAPFGSIKPAETKKEDTSQKDTETTSTTTTTKPAFGTSATTPAFGSSSFGASTTTPAFGSTSFGTSATTPAFGSTSFGASTSKPAFGSTSFGSPKTTPPASSESTSSTTGGFGALAKNTVPGASNPTSSPSFGSSTGFGALAKNTVPGATAPTSTPSFGSSTGFGALAKNTVPGATAPTSSPSFGSSTGFGALAKNTIPGATAPTSTPSFGSSSFGSLAKNTVPGAANPSVSPSFGSSSGFGNLAKNTVAGAKNPNDTPAFGSTSSFGATTTTTTTTTKSDTEKPATATTTTSPLATTKPTSTSGFGSLAKSPASTTTSSATESSSKTTPTASSALKAEPKVSTAPKTESKASTTPVATTSTSKETGKGPVSTEKEGIAYHFESDYFNTKKLLEEGEKIFKLVSDQIDKSSHALGSKTIDNLKTATDWNLNDIAAFKKILDDLTKDMADKVPKMSKMREQIGDLAENLTKLIQKRKNIKDLTDQELNSELIDMMDARKLSKETREELNVIQGKASALLVLLEQLELKVHELRKRYKLYNPESSNELSLYSLHRMIRDIERGLTSKKRDLEKVSEALSRLSIQDAQRKARYATHGYSCDFSDSEDDEEEPIKTSSIEYTQKYIYRTQFMDSLCDTMAKKKPLQASAII